MKIETHPEIHISYQFLEERKDIITKIIYLEDGIIDVELEHPVLGSIVEIYLKTPRYLTLKGVILPEFESLDELEIAQDYYNNYILGGYNTYLTYTHPEYGYYLSSRND